MHLNDKHTSHKSQIKSSELEMTAYQYKPDKKDFKINYNLDRDFEVMKIESGLKEAAFKNVIAKYSSVVDTRFKELAYLTRLVESLEKEKAVYQHDLAVKENENSELKKLISSQACKLEEFSLTKCVIESNYDKMLSDSNISTAELNKSVSAHQFSLNTRFKELATLTYFLEDALQEKEILSLNEEKLKVSLKKSNRENFDLKKRLKENIDKLKKIEEELQFERMRYKNDNLILMRKIKDKDQELELRFQEIHVLTKMFENTTNNDVSAAIYNREHSEVNNLRLNKYKGIAFSSVSYLSNKYHSSKKLKLAVEEIANSNYFDKDWYLRQYPDVRNDPKFSNNAALHYAKFGGFEGRNPSSYFDSQWYLDQNPDVQVSGINPLLHFIRYGKSENRKPTSKNDISDE